MRENTKYSNDLSLLHMHNVLVLQVELLIAQSIPFVFLFVVLISARDFLQSKIKMTK